MTFPTAVRCWVIAICVFSLNGLLHAEEELDSASLLALSQTQALLNDPTQRDAFIQKSPNAQLVDGQVASLSGNANVKESIYHLSSQVMEDVVKSTGGDVEKMTRILLNAKNNPKAFYEGLTPESRKAIDTLSRQIESAPTTSTSRAPASQ